MRKIAYVLVGAVTLMAAAGVAQAVETRFAVQDSAGTVDKMVVTDGGNIGVGTTTPEGAVHAKGNTYPITQIIGQWVGTNANGGSGFLGFHNNDAGALPNANDRLGYFLFGSMNGTTRMIGAGMTVKAEKTWTTTSAPTTLSFEVTPENSVGRVERFKILSSGNVGIGTSTPTQRLEVAGGVKLAPATGVARPGCTSALRGVIWFGKNDTTGMPDTFDVCVKDANGLYNWHSVY